MKRNDNKIKIKNYLEKIDETQIQSMKITNKMIQEMKGLRKCLFSAPAIIRRGYVIINNLVGSCIDPLTTSKSKEKEVVECSDITDSSKFIAKKYGLDF